jgi:amino acid adenylation domain-containing protein
MTENGSLDLGRQEGCPFEPFPDEALEASLVDRFEVIARRHAARLAISDPVRSLSYAELAVLVSRIAASTAAVTERAGPVAILLPQEVRFPAAMLGVLTAGRCYVPLNIDDPPDRNRLFSLDAEIAAVVSAGDTADRARSIFPPSIPILDLDAMTDRGAPNAHRAGPDDLASILYTSGSTGTPKGVCQHHRGLLFSIQQRAQLVRLSCEDRIAVISPPSSNFGMRDTLCGLLNGASVHILPPRTLHDRLPGELRARAITIYLSVPTVFRRVVEALSDNERLDTVRLVYLAGDRIGWSDFDAFRRVCRADAAFAVGLASTEALSNYTWWVVDGRLRESCPRLPVGYGVGDPQIALLDEDGRSVADGEIGEIVLSGRHLARGYRRADERAAFGMDTRDPQQRTYRTGDMARRRSDGLFEFVGRKDHQIKLHGQRIDVAEVESALSACIGVRDAAIVVRRNAGGDARSLVGYAELQQSISGMLPRHLLAMVSQRLPRHMMPSAINIVAELPRLPNLKVDRERLAELDARAAATPDRDDDPLVTVIREVFETVLGFSATPDDNVLTLGGDSMQAITIALELEQRFDIEIPLDTFEAVQSIRELAGWIASQRCEETAALASA